MYQQIISELVERVNRLEKEKSENTRSRAVRTGVCPMCEDCPDGCPIETPKDGRNKQPQKELAQLAIESVEREKVLAKLEAEVEVWAQAEADGRLVVLPVSPGGDVYIIDGAGRIKKVRTQTYPTTLDVDGMVSPHRYFLDDIYVTRAEAEDALKKTIADMPNDYYGDLCIGDALNEIDDAPTLAEKNQQLAASQRRERAAVECLERAMYTATTNPYDVEMCCMYCKYGPEGTCEGASTVLAGNPIDGQEYDWDCRRCSGVTVNDRGGWEFDYERWRSDVAGEGENDE